MYMYYVYVDEHLHVVRTVHVYVYMYSRCAGIYVNMKAHIDMEIGRGCQHRLEY
jgi:hypothetical protein